MTGYRYVLVIPARNEGKYISKTLGSVVSQTRLPEKWIIVNDGSTDKTAETVMQYANTYKWIELVEMPKRDSTDFGGQARSLNAGYQRLKGIEYDSIGYMDADISFEADYFEFLTNKFAEYPRLGVAGTPYVEGGSDTSRRVWYDEEHVHGACQMFRRECFEAVGQFIPIEIGGHDKIAVTLARSYGWETRSFPEKKLFHHCSLGFDGKSPLITKFRYGMKDYVLCNHPLWEIIRATYQMRNKPYVLGGILLMAGYLRASLSRSSSSVPEIYKQFHRREQMLRLKSFLKAVFRV